MKNKIDMKFEVLLSCMHKKNFDIIETSNLNNVKTLIINQCDINQLVIKDEKHRIINTNTRGLSVSRNMALDNAMGDICLLCDDDEIFVDGLEKIIMSAYEKVPEADVFIFGIQGKTSSLGNKVKRLKRYQLLKVSSVQISFKRNAILGKIKFDELLGAGTGNGAGEETKFLLECFKKGLSIYYCPIKIAVLEESTSTWFEKYDSNYFYQRGSVTRYIYGLLFASIYALYFSITKYNMYKKDCGFLNSIYQTFKGIFDNKISKIRSQKNGC